MPPLDTISLTRRRGVCIAAFLALAAAGWLAPSPAWADEATIEISSPQPEETIHDNSGSVAVTVAVRNGRVAAKLLRFRVLLDGETYGPIQDSPSFTLSGVERGEHALRVELLDSSGNALASSPSVTFYMWQASRLFPGRK